jgi:hypothetical protein
MNKKKGWIFEIADAQRVIILLTAECLIHEFFKLFFHSDGSLYDTSRSNMRHSNYKPYCPPFRKCCATRKDYYIIMGRRKTKFYEFDNFFGVNE